MQVDLAYDYCQDVTRREAANFFYGIRLLPLEKRRALSAVYALARRVDDIGDGDLPASEKLSGLDDVRERLDRMSLITDDPITVALTDTSSRFPIQISAFHDLVDGVEMDVREVTYQTFNDLHLYCKRVAGSIGRLSLAIFGSTYPELAGSRAEALGVALQITNILRDVREDYERGRVYIPAEDLDMFGTEVDLDKANHDGLVDAIAFEAERAREWFARGLSLLPLLEGRSYACAAAMAGIYSRILRRIAKNPEQVLHRRISLPVWEKAWVAVRSIAGGMA
ncbi:MAG: presqualene diphosphate synthase HpnD [Chloroflexi bacterium]|nr:presqualene diphosphate synthase HpnD [Chloroflexota bacterium]MCY3937951.1 presqualene diphosphate synthase HpnD [Chloroflexota bacterium]